MFDSGFEPAFTRKGDVVEIRLRRLFEDDLERIWAALTEPQRLVQWLAPGEIELRPGGAARLSFEDSGIVIDSTVTAIEPLHKRARRARSPIVLDDRTGGRGRPTHPDPGSAGG